MAALVWYIDFGRLECRLRGLLATTIDLEPHLGTMARARGIVAQSAYFIALSLILQLQQQKLQPCNVIPFVPPHSGSGARV